MKGLPIAVHTLLVFTVLLVPCTCAQSQCTPEQHILLLQVASYMRAVLRTLAQFHSHRLLHRDIKPGTGALALLEATSLDLLPSTNWKGAVEI